VALAAVSDGADEILAARHAGHGGGRRWRLLGREGHEPGGQEDALEHGHGDLFRRVLATHGRDGAEEGDHGLEVAVGHAVEGRERVNGEDALAIGPPAESYRRADLLVRPAADPRGLVGRDVRRVHGPEGTFELLAARVGLALGLGMAAAAARGAEDVLAAGDLGRVSGEGGAGPPGHEAGREKKSAHGSYPNAKLPSSVPTSFKIIEEACRQASLLFCTRTDAAELWGFSGTPEFVLRKMAQRFAENNTNKTIVLTLGSEGAAQFQNGEYSIEPIFPTEGTVRFGSGDAFAAGYLYAYLEEQHNHDLRKERGITPLVFGNALAALKRCIAGDIANITLQELWALLYKQERIRFR